MADGLSGNSPDLLDAVEACVGVTALVAIPAETRGGLQRPQTEEKRDRDKGATRAKRVGVASPTAPCSVATGAASLPASRGYRRTVSAGTTGSSTYACARQRVTLCTDGLPDRTVWLVSTRTMGAAPVSAYYLSKAPARPPLRTFVWLSGVRWALAQCLAAGQTE